jgi:hypothetical protein
MAGLSRLENLAYQSASPNSEITAAPSFSPSFPRKRESSSIKPDPDEIPAFAGMTGLAV